MDRLPGAYLLKQAWDATKLAGAIKAYRSTSVVPTKPNPLAAFKGPKANKRLKELFEDKNYVEMCKCFLFDPIVELALDFSNLWWRVWDIYWIFIIIRILFAFTQTGYIHPDEYFQSVEVITGDVLSLKTNTPWEFNVTAPLRSPSVPYVLYGLPLSLLRGVNFLFHHYTGYNFFIGSFMVSLIPRIVILTSSFIVDFTVYKICILYKHSYNQCLTTLASSYVMIVFASRSFSNTLEMIMTSLLIYWTAHCMRRTQETVYLHSRVQKEADEADTIAERVKINKKRKLIPGHDYKYFLHLSMICAIGVYNRPTFFIYASMPLFYWFQRNIAVDSYWTPFQTFNFRIFSIAPGFFLTALILLFTDSLYFGELTLKKIWNLTMNWEDWKLTPLNFILYNVVPGNLSNHGTHPFWHHMLINIPLLFGPLGIVSLITVLNFVTELFFNDWRRKPGLRTVFSMTMMTYIVSLGLLSVFPHQEPRFLIPLIVPIVLMNAHKLRWKFGEKKPFLTLWYIFNITLAVFYGYFHQAGVVPMVTHISNHFGHRHNEVNVIFSKTYMPPTFPLLRPNTKRTESEYSKNININFIDLSGKPLDQVINQMNTLYSRELFVSIKKKKEEQTESYVVLPGCAFNEIKVLLQDKNISLSKVHSVFPHISTEYLPSYDIYNLYFKFSNRDFSPSIFFSGIFDIAYDFSLILYRIESKEN
ncbi:GPI mannosyltransferase 4 [Lepeophtheirus salmonis]|nr:GPI mannosyltransferase 4-like [Lepeophtheirus salmonis]